MDKQVKGSRGFREELRQELDTWRSEGLITEDQARALQDRYALADLGKETTGLLLMTIYLIGSLLIAGGVVTFVAAHWDSIPKAVKVAMLMAAMLAAHVSGYVLWRVKGTRPRLGHALVVLGTLIFGANIALMAQIFHISSDSWNALAAWAVGAAVMAYCLWSVPNAVIAVVTSFIWYCSWFMEAPGSVNWYPLVLAAAGLPLAYVKRSGTMFFLVLLAFGACVQMGAGASTDSPRGGLLASAAVACLLTAYGAYHVAVRPRPEVGATALTLGAVSLAGWLYVLSFQAVAGEFERHAWDVKEEYAVAGLAAPALVFCCGLVLWALCARKCLADKVLRPVVVAVWVGVLAMAVIGALSPMAIVTVVLFNAALVLLGVGLLWSGFVSLRRAAFWPGVVILGGVILSRFLEYETGLIVKSIVFLLLGVGVIAGGVKFESLLRKRRAIDA